MVRRCAERDAIETFEESTDAPAAADTDQPIRMIHPTIVRGRVLHSSAASRSFFASSASFSLRRSSSSASFDTDSPLGLRRPLVQLQMECGLKSAHFARPSMLEHVASVASITSFVRSLSLILQIMSVQGILDKHPARGVQYNLYDEKGSCVGHSC